MRIRKHTEIKCDICGKQILYDFSPGGSLFHYIFKAKDKLWLEGILDQYDKLDICENCMEKIKEKIKEELNNKNEI